MTTPDAWRLDAAKGMSEAVLLSRVTRLARALGWWTYHAPDNRPNARGGVQRTAPGFPDLVLIHAGQRRIIYRELKTQSGRIRPEQHEVIGLLRTASGLEHPEEIADVWRPLDLLEGRIERDLTRPRIYPF